MCQQLLLANQQYYSQTTISLFLGRPITVNVLGSTLEFFSSIQGMPKNNIHQIIVLAIFCYYPLIFYMVDLSIPGRVVPFCGNVVS